VGTGGGFWHLEESKRISRAEERKGEIKKNMARHHKKMLYAPITLLEPGVMIHMDPQASDAIIQTLLDHPLESGLLPISVDKKEKNIII